MTESAEDIARATRGFLFNQTMLRIRDPELSLAFYRDVLGMRLVKRLDFPEMEFSLYFLAYADTEEVGDVEHAFGREGVLELTHNHGTESDSHFAGYHDGNAQPQGFGHIGVTVPDVYAACERFERLGIKFVKRPDDGKMRGLAFVKDPDGYWIEILSTRGMEEMLQPR